MEFRIKTSSLPTKGIYYNFKEIVLRPTIAPAEPITKPETKPEVLPRPAEDDPFNVPAPKVDPTPKGFIKN